MTHSQGNNRFIQAVSIIVVVLILMVVVYRLGMFLTQSIVINDSGLFAEMTAVLLDSDRVLYTDFWDHKPPMLFFFTAPFVAIFGQTTLAIQLAGVAILYFFVQGNVLLASTFTKARGSLWFAGLVSLNFGMLIIYTRGIETTLLMTAFSTHALYFINSNRPAAKPYAFVIAGFLYTLAFMSKQPVATEFLIFLLLIAYISPLSKLFFNLVVFGVGAGIGLALFGAWGLATGNLLDMWQAAFVTNVSYSVGTEGGWIFDPANFEQTLFFLQRETLPVFLPLLLFWAIGFIVLWQADEDKKLLFGLLLWLGSTLAGAAIGQTMKISYFTQVIPPIVVMGALAIPYLQQTYSRMVQVVLILTISTSLLTGSLGYVAGVSDFLQRTRDGENVLALAQYLNENTTEDECIWLWGYSHNILYYADRHACSPPAHDGMVMIDASFDTVNNRIDFVEGLLFNNPAYVVYTSAWSLPPQLEQFARRYLRDGVSGFNTRVQVLDMSSWQDYEANFDNLFSLIGFDDFQEGEICAGDTVAYALTYRVHQSPAQYYQMFFQIRDAETHATLAGIDRAPQRDYPTQDWQIEGEIILGDSISLTIPEDIEAGNYYLVTGFYDTETLDRLPIVDSAGQMVGSETVLQDIVIGCDSVG